MVLEIENCKIRKEEDEMFVEYWDRGMMVGYVAWLRRWYGGMGNSFGELGSIGDGWIVVLNSGRSYLFPLHSKESVVATRYIAEKFDLRLDEAVFYAKVLALCWECQVV